MENQNTPASPVNPFQKLQAEHLNAGTVEIESSRAIAEAQGKLVIAKKFPRDAAGAFDRAMSACSSKKLAEIANYSYPRGGETISGPSIRLAEELARVWGNIDYGIRELSQKNGVSEMEAYCWDLETNTFSSQKFTVKHERHTRTGVKKLTDPRDIYELTANNAGRRLRARILAVLPVELVDAAVQKCRQTLVSGPDPIEARIQKAVSAFLRYGITPDLISKRLEKPLSEANGEDIADLLSIFNSIKDGHSSVHQWFDVEAPEIAEKSAVNAVILGGKNHESINDEPPIVDEEPAVI